MNSPSIGPLGLLGVILIFLRVAEVIDWSWWWVTLPLWGGAVLGTLMVIVAIVCATVVLMKERR